MKDAQRQGPGGKDLLQLAALQVARTTLSGNNAIPSPANTAVRMTTKS